MTNKIIQKTEVLNTNPPQVCIIYTDGTGMTIVKSEWDKQNQ